MLIVEDDLNFAKILRDLAREIGFKVLWSDKGDRGLKIAKKYQPSAIILDFCLPAMDGSVVLDRLKHDRDTCHIPVQILTVEPARRFYLSQGAISCLQKPCDTEKLSTAISNLKAISEIEIKNLLLIENDPIQRQNTIDLIGDRDLNIHAVASLPEAIEIVKQDRIDCIVVNLEIPATIDFQAIEEIKQQTNSRDLGIVLYIERKLTDSEKNKLQSLSQTNIIKIARSLEEILYETTLLLHRKTADLSPEKQEIIERVEQENSILANRKILAIDDDPRNIFALTSLLERYKIQVIYAESGKEGIAKLQEDPEIEIVLVDIMMPEMDGYETIRTISSLQQFQSIPTIALTAKAMKGDREKCLAAGASDYITKPVEIQELLSLLRVWIYRSRNAQNLNWLSDFELE
ncbi:MAG: response regulator [Prochloraceae cyanobacterium]